MTATLPIAVASWVWPTTTVAAAVVTAALIAVLTAHVLLTAASGPRGGHGATRASNELEPSGGGTAEASPLRRSLRRAAVPLAGSFAVAVLVRFAIILIERPGP